MQTRQKGANAGVNPGFDTQQVGEMPAASSSFSEAPAASSPESNASRDVFSPGQKLSVELLNSQVSHAERAAFGKADQNPSGAELYARYAALCGAQKELTRVATVAQNAAKTAVGEERQKLISLKWRCLTSLRKLGTAFAIQTPIFAKVVHGGNSWPTRCEEGPNGRRYVNSFKSSKLLNESDKQAYFEKKLAGFRARGGTLAADILSPVRQEEFIDSVRYDYCLVEDGGFRAAPRREGDPDPGHMILAEGGPHFKDTRVSMAGELMVTRDSQGDVVAAFVACNSGHFKPYAEDLPRMLPILEKIGISKEKVIFIGGPNNPNSLLPEIAEKFSLDENGQAKNSVFRPWQRPSQGELGLT